jgi:hypothetical protein
VVADKFLWRVPGLATLLEVFERNGELTPGTVEQVVSLLKEGHVVAVSPGGTREALFSSSNYECLWGGRLGAFKTAVEAQIVIYSFFFFLN